MLVTITEYRNSAKSPNGESWSLGAKGDFVQVQSAAADGNLVAHADTRLIRVSTDTAITVNPNGTAELVMPGESWFAVAGGETIAIATVV